MNLSLIDPFILAQDIPENLFARVGSSGVSVCIRFSQQGDFLASGTGKGSITIFDLETYGVARKLRGHTPGRQVSSLSWSASGQYLLSAALDWRCMLWDLQDGSCIRQVNIGAPIFNAEIHPGDQFRCIVAALEDDPVLVNMTDSSSQISSISSTPKETNSDDDNQVVEKSAAEKSKIFTTSIAFDPSGKFIFAGTSKGWINIIDAQDDQHKTLYSLRLCTKPVLHLRVSPDGRTILTNSADTIIRTLKLPDFHSTTFTPDTIRLEIEHKFQDVVNKLSWNHISFSSNSDYVIASTHMHHDIYIWERGHGSLVKILEGPREELGAIDWHPLKPLVAATGMESGRVHIWSVKTPQRWSALAPDFAEVEENQEYIEREDEFDILEAGEVVRRREGGEGEKVDVLTMSTKSPYDSLISSGVVSNKNGVDLFRMPVLLDIYASDSEDDMVAVGAGQFRRKSHVGGDLVDDTDNVMDGGGGEKENNINNNNTNSDVITNSPRISQGKSMNGTKRKRKGVD